MVAASRAVSSPPYFSFTVFTCVTCTTKMLDELIDEVLSPQLPDTAPVDSQIVETPVAEPSWGKLIPISKCKQVVTVLTETSYSIGRSTRCEVVITKDHVDQNLLLLISKVHFKIVKGDCDEGEIPLVYLIDESSNGTYVNGALVGKNKKVIIGNGDEISLAKPIYDVYMYVDSSAIDSWLPSVMRNQYQVLKHLGNGGFGEVKLVIEKSTALKFAIKKLPKDKLEDEEIYNEINILKTLNHRSIVMLYKVEHTNEAVYIALEYMSGGTLINRIKQEKKLCDFESKVIFFQLVKAIEYLHSQSITHRDLKPDNILLMSQGCKEGYVIKIADFGLSKVIDSKTNLHTTCGTFQYMAPEILSGCGKKNYTPKVDIWSLGVVLYLCLSGSLPFACANENKTLLMRQIMLGAYCMTSSVWNYVCTSAKKLLRKMLVVSVDERISIAEIYAHKWLQDKAAEKRVLKLYQSNFSDDENISPPRGPTTFPDAKRAKTEKTI